MKDAIENRWVISVRLTPPTLADNTADTDRLLEKLKKDLKTDHIQVDLELVRSIPKRLRAFQYAARCVLFKDREIWVLVNLYELDSRTPIAGLAVDIGTTRVVTRLIDLETGKHLAGSSFDNPQAAIGPDVLARIHHTENSDGLEELNRLILERLNQDIFELCNSCGLTPDDINLISGAGNTVMTHLFLGLEPRWIIREPYIPAVNRPGLVHASTLGIHVNPKARVFVFPNVGSYFGGDLIAGIYYSGIHEKEEASILVDVGTNAEVVLGDKHWLMACAGAAGPALEGGVTKMGTTAGPGVIDRVKIDPRTLDFTLSTIEGKPAKGICGSGVIDLAAQLFVTGMIDIRGKILPDRCGNRYFEKNGEPHIIVAGKDETETNGILSIGQADLDSLIRSKAAMYTILETITTSVGLTLDALTTFYVAGTFGSFIDPKSAITIGMIPDLPLSCYRTLGNSSLEGATLSLVSSGAMTEIFSIRDRITYMELNVNQDFMNRFSAAKFLPHTDPSRFLSVKAP